MCTCRFVLFVLRVVRSVWCDVSFSCATVDHGLSFFPASNRQFCSCVLSYLALNASEAEGNLALIQTSLLFSC